MTSFDTVITRIHAINKTLGNIEQLAG